MNRDAKFLAQTPYLKSSLCFWSMCLSSGPPLLLPPVYFSGVRSSKSMFAKHFRTHECKMPYGLLSNAKPLYSFVTFFLMLFQACCCRPTLFERCKESSMMGQPLWVGEDLSRSGCRARVSVTQCFVQPCVFKRANWLELPWWRLADLAAGSILSSYSMGVKSSFKSSPLPARGTWRGAGRRGEAL